MFHWCSDETQALLASLPVLGIAWVWLRTKGQKFLGLFRPKAKPVVCEPRICQSLHEHVYDNPIIKHKPLIEAPGMLVYSCANCELDSDSCDTWLGESCFSQCQRCEANRAVVIVETGAWVSEAK